MKTIKKGYKSNKKKKTAYSSIVFNTFAEDAAEAGLTLLPSINKEKRSIDEMFKSLKELEEKSIEELLLLFDNSFNNVEELSIEELLLLFNNENHCEI